MVNLVVIYFTTHSELSTEKIVVHGDVLTELFSVFNGPLGTSLTQG